MEASSPASRRGQVLLYMAVALSLAMSLVDGDSSSCTPAIDMAGHQRFNKSPGESLTLKCPVRLCYLGLPNVTWCKINGELCDLMKNGEGINMSMNDHKKDSAVYLLRFDFVQGNDTGYYRCRAVFKEQQIVSSTVTINISDKYVAENNTTTNIKGNTTNSEKFQNFTLLIYIMSSMGVVCVLIIVVSLLIYCQKHFKVKHRSSPKDPVPTEELQFVVASGIPKNFPQQIQGGTPAPMVEVTYDNAHLGYKSTRKSVSISERDSIVYADLNHNAKKASFKFQDDCEVEYAVVHLNETMMKK